MDQIALVDRRIEDGYKLLLQLAHDGFDIAAAFWLKGPEDAWPHLFIASRMVDRLGPTEAYQTVQASLQRLPGLGISLVDIKLIGVANVITRAVRKQLQTADGDHPMHFRGGQIAHLAVEEAYLYPPPLRHRRHQFPWGKVKLKSPVEQTSWVGEKVAPLSPQEERALEQLVASGISPVQADYWVRKKREQGKAPIPAGTTVNAVVTAWWGDNPEDDPNPLLLVEAPDGAQGLTFKSNTEPV